jgi:hypothetical protein
MRSDLVDALVQGLDDIVGFAQVEAAEQARKPQPIRQVWAVGSMEWLAEQSTKADNPGPPPRPSSLSRDPTEIRAASPSTNPPVQELIAAPGLRSACARSRCAAG